ncbi:armadillo repeat-containing protein 3 isoform X2 [Trichomycterus rosablanca]|uniref:armadillo repeat-containing protein 3 isoform X2 n=1 Tax=Trichomycterus rosablanca TaxID=2290929 RepID=UPI002F35FF5A
MGKKVKKEPEAAPKEVFDPLPIESKKAATVVLMLSSPEEEVLTKACEAIYRFAEKGDENRSSLLALGAVEPLTCLISHEDKTVRRYAVMALGVMASNNDVKKLMKKLNIIPSVISRLAPEEDVVIHEFGTLCLASLSVDFTCKVQIFDHDGLQALIRLLSSPDPDVKKNSVECVYNLVQESSCRVAVRELSGLAPLLELLSSEFPVIQQLALRTLASISTDRETRTALRQEHGITRLMEVLTTKEFSDLHVDVLKVVSNCLQDVESVQLVQGNGGLEKLLHFIVTPSSPDIQTNAVQTVGRAAQSSENQKILHEQNVEKALVDLLAVQNDGVQAATCQAVAAMSKNPSSKDTFRQLDGIRSVVQLLNSEGNELKEAAAEALSNLTNGSHTNAYAVYEAEGDELLVQLLQDGSPGATVHAAAVLTNMASQDVLRCSILSHGAMQALLTPLNSADIRVLVSATQTVATLACDAEGRAQLRNVGGLPLLVSQLKSSNADVRRNACWAISVCANDEPTATDLCRLGALELLQEINTSLNSQNQFSEAALQKLLDKNLSVKYSLTGRLSFTDITTDGFYDPGQVRKSHGVPALEDIAKQGVNQHRAVIAVNGKPPDQLITESAEETQHDSPPGTQTSSVVSSKGISKTSSKIKGKGRREDEKQKDEDDYKPQLEAPIEKPSVPPYDVAFHNLITKATESVLPLREEVDVYSALAKLVSDAMGGPVDAEKQHEFPWELHLSELKFELRSNIVPVGRIRKGTYYHRALLFKVLADRLGVSCSLVRGEYNRAWNEVLLTFTSKNENRFHLQPQSYVIDLIHRPGNLMKSGTPAATQYQTI